MLGLLKTRGEAVRKVTGGGRALHCTASPLRSTSSKAGENEINGGMGVWVAMTTVTQANHV